MKEIIDEIKRECDLYHTPYNDKSSKDLIILCPSCLKEGKHKVKLYIRKDNLTYHCFRCGIKGNILTINSVLKQLGFHKSLLLVQKYSYDLLYTLENESIKYFKSIIIKQISDIMSDEDLFKQYLKIINHNILKNQNELTVAEYNKNTEIDIEFKKYLDKRNIPEYLLKFLKIPYFKGYNHLFHLYGRLIIPTYMNTNYEARLISDFANIRYLKRKNPDIIFDFPLFLIKNKEYIKPKFNININLDYIIVTEGIFDCLTLVREGINCISSGGYGNSFGVMMFIKLLNNIFKINFNKIIFVYDKDLNNRKLNIIRNIIYSYFGNEYDIKMIQLQQYKDINEIPPEEFPKFEYDLDELIY